MGRLSPRTISDYRWQAERFLEPALGRRKVADVTRDHVERMVSPLPKTLRNRVLALTSRLFNLFEQWEWRQQRSNVGSHVLRDLLGHTTTEMADRYIRSVGDPVREAREQVGAEMAAMMDGEGG